MTFGSEFLTLPDLFPARDSGERWGELELALAFAGGTYCFRGLGRTQHRLLTERYEELQVAADSGAEVIPIDVFRVAPSDFRTPEPLPGRPYSMDLDYGPDVVRVAAPKLMGRVSLAPLRGALWTSVEQPLDEIVGVFENFFRLIVAYRLSQIGGALLHSAGTIRNGRAFLFLGQSGAGKSTISKINQDLGLEVLSDDMNALVLDGQRTLVEKLPFAGDLGQTARRRGGAPLAGIYRLQKATEHALHPLPEPEALALLLSCAPYLNADPFRTDRLMQNLAALIRGAVVRRLAFRRDGDFWNLLEKGQ